MIVVVGLSVSCEFAQNVEIPAGPCSAHRNAYVGFYDCRLLLIIYILKSAYRIRMPDSVTSAHLLRIAFSSDHDGRACGTAAWEKSS